MGLGVSLSGARGASSQPAQGSPGAAAAELSSSSAPSKIPVCLCVWSCRAERARLKGTQSPCGIRGAMRRSRRVNEINVIKEGGDGLGARGSRRCPSAASSAWRGCDSTLRTHSGTRPVHLGSSKHFCASSWDSCQLPDRNQSARWPNAAPREAQVPCSNLSGAPELEVSAARSNSAGGNNCPQPWCQEVQLMGVTSAPGADFSSGQVVARRDKVRMLGISCISQDNAVF